MNNKEKRLILIKYKDNLYKILTYENLLIKDNDYKFLNNFLTDLLIIQNKNINYKYYNYNFLITEYLINKYNINLYKYNYHKRIELQNKYLKKMFKEIINNIIRNDLNYNSKKLLYYFIIEFFKSINKYSNEIYLNENDLNSIKRNMKNIIKEIEF